MLGKIAVGLAYVVVAGALFALGRLSADDDDSGGAGSAAAATARADGLREGMAAGLREGRALQASESAAPGARRAFASGYTAGANDVFGGFDGGWSLSTPYVITLRHGSGPITYRIDSRRPALGTAAP